MMFDLPPKPFVAEVAQNGSEYETPRDVFDLRREAQEAIGDWYAKKWWARASRSVAAPLKF